MVRNANIPPKSTNFPRKFPPEKFPRAAALAAARTTNYTSRMATGMVSPDNN
jgi:hypothetical protein